jgi:hypothetical protein
MSRVLKGCLGLSLAIGMTAGYLPAQASEVVKLARLVVSGKRASTDTVKAPSQDARPGGNSQAHGNGGNDDTGTAPAPSRGVS